MVDLYVSLLTHRSDVLDPHQVKHLFFDIGTIKSRSKNEGISFLTKTLPLLGKSLDQGMMNSKFCCPKQFGTVRGGCIPEFLQVYFNLVFDLDGYLKERPDEEAIKFLRQVLYMAYKLEIPSSDSDKAVVINDFIMDDEEISRLNFEGNTLNGILSSLGRNVFEDFDPHDITPRHGPGAVASGERNEEKWNFSTKYSDLHQMYPYYRYFIVGGAHELIDRLAWYKSLTTRKSGCAKVYLVPKDSRGPRLISAEPLEYMWIQQGLGRKVMSHLEHNFMTRGHVNFSSQTINQELALSSSKDGKFATLDLKRASDRVSMQLVRLVFEKVPLFLRCLEATRTTETLLPDGRVLPLNKFAPMGSALCFPIEAFVFWAICVSAIRVKSRQPLHTVRNSVFVFGDDLIIPTAYAEDCMHALTSYGLIVNEAKSCIKGNFRESCGVDAFNGINVTPIRIKTLWAVGRPSGDWYTSYVAFANLMLQKGYKFVYEFVMHKISSKVKRSVPFGTSRSSYPCQILPYPAMAESLNAHRTRKRWNNRYQRFEYLVYSLIPKKQDSLLDGWTRLLRNNCVGVGDDPGHFVSRGVLTLHLRWAPV